MTLILAKYTKTTELIAREQWLFIMDILKTTIAIVSVVPAPNPMAKLWLV